MMRHSRRMVVNGTRAVESSQARRRLVLRIALSLSSSLRRGGTEEESEAQTLLSSHFPLIYRLHLVLDLSILLSAGRGWERRRKRKWTQGLLRKRDGAVAAGCGLGGATRELCRSHVVWYVYFQHGHCLRHRTFNDLCRRHSRWDYEQIERLGGLSYFAGAETKDEHVLVPDLGPLTSIYDRARQLFYYLKGGQVDYGEEHSKRCGHCQFGNVYERGHYESWDEQHPVHFVGHSAGVQVIRVLQQMLADKAFKGYEDTSADWVLSVTSLSGALNGTTRTYMDGMQPEDGRSMKRLCLLQLCRIGVILYEWMDIPWLKKYYSFGFDHFRMGWSSLGIFGLIDSLLANNGGGPFTSGDWILPDLTLQGSMQLNGTLNTFPNTFYFSYATKRTTKLMGITVPSSILGIHPLLFIRVLQMTRWRHPPNALPPYKGFRDEDWHDNDGAINTLSMTHPRIPAEHPSQFVQDEHDSECHPLRPGIWYYKIVEADHVLFIVNRERAGAQFDVIYDSIFERCRKHVNRTTICLQ